ncbi:MAG: response regulator [Ardenticatenaceae bacterium]|nr:response regulator [Ardenticatenaceae bacterium]
MRILIADDESIIRMGLKAILRDMGHSVIDATNGREALQMARKHHPDMAILDINMPYTDGIKTARALCKSTPMPIIMLTAYADGDLIEQATDLPIQGYLIKPVDPKSLQAAVAVAVKRFDQVQALEADKEKLGKALETRKVIDKAKGKLMAEKGLSEEDAYRLLQLRARESRHSILEVARAVLK